MILSYILSKGGLVNDIHDVFGTSALLDLLNNTSINTITKINKYLLDHTCTCTLPIIMLMCTLILLES